MGTSKHQKKISDVLAGWEKTLQLGRRSGRSKKARGKKGKEKSSYRVVIPKGGPPHSGQTGGHTPREPGVLFLGGGPLNGVGENSGASLRSVEEAEGKRGG